MSKFEVFLKSEADLSGLVVDGAGTFYAAAANGTVVDLDGKAYADTGGEPSAVAISQAGCFVADLAHKALLAYSPEDGVSKVVDNFDETPLLGPSAVCADDDGEIFFCDSGGLGESSLEKPTGAVYSVTGQERVLVPLASGLAQPSGVASSGSGASKCVYVTELLRNRVLRGVQMPTGVYHFSVFHQFAGGFGPSGVACDAASGNVFVARQDAPSGVGSVAVLSPRGKLLAEEDTPAPLLSGIAVGGDFVYVSEATTKTVYRIPVSELA